jgi:hypothetical protein
MRVGAVPHRIARRVELREAGNEEHGLAVGRIRRQVGDVDAGVVVHALHRFPAAEVGACGEVDDQRVEREISTRVEPLEGGAIRQQVKWRVEVRPGVVGEPEALAGAGHAAGGPHVPLVARSTRAERAALDSRRLGHVDVVRRRQVDADHATSTQCPDRDDS